MAFEIDKIKSLQIGVQGENIARSIPIDMTSWVDELEADGIEGYQFHVLFQPYNDPNVYPMVSTYDAETKVLSWKITAAATTTPGVGYAEVRAQESTTGLIKKTRVIPTSVEKSVSGIESDPPEVQEAWVTVVLNASTDAVNAAETAVSAKEAAETARDAAQAAAGNFQDLSATVTGLPENTLPTVNVTHSEGGYYNIALGIPKGDTGDPAPEEQVVPAVNSYLQQVITNPDSPPLDRTLTQPLGAAPADMAGDIKKVLEDMHSLFKVAFTDEIEVVSGGLHGDDGTSFESTARARTTYNSVKAGQAYLCVLGNDVYKVKNAFLYNAQGLGQRITQDDDNYFICYPTATRNRIRMSFSKAADESAEIGAADIQAISNALSIYCLFDDALETEKAFANAKVVGDQIRKAEDEIGTSTEYLNRFYFNLGVMPSTEIKGITYSIDEDNVLTLNGTPTENVYFQIMGGDRKDNVRNLTADKPVILRRELISGTATGFPVFRNTYDYNTSEEGSAVEVDHPFVPTSNGCLFLRLATNTSFTNAKYRFMVTDGAVLYPFMKHERTGADKALRQQMDLSIRSRMLFDAAIKSKGRMLFSAHRGAEGQAPYGSYPSYKLACRQGWDMIQIAQARQSADGTWYCLHDSTVDAQTDGTGSIAELTDAYIATIKQDVGENISMYSDDELRLPTLESVIQLAYRYGLMVSIRMGSLPGLDGLGNIPPAWTSFIALCKKYFPERMMFSGTLNQVIALKALTPNWHGQVYVTSDTVLDTLATLKSYGYTNISILALDTYIDADKIAAIHEAGYYYVVTQIYDPTVEKFIALSNAGADVAQTGISSIHSIMD